MSIPKSAYQVKIALTPENKKDFKTVNFSGLVIATDQAKAVELGMGKMKEFTEKQEVVMIPKLISCLKIRCEFMLVQQDPVKDDSKD